MRETRPRSDVWHDASSDERVFADFKPSSEGQVSKADGQQCLIEFGCLRDLRSVCFDVMTVLGADALPADFEVPDNIEGRCDRHANCSCECRRPKVRTVDCQLLADKPEELAVGARDKPGAVQANPGPGTPKKKIPSAGGRSR